MPKRVLIVEDDADQRLGLEIRLKANGFDVASAPNVAKAITMAKPLAPDVILLDLGLPDGDGFEVVRRLREDGETAEIPIIILTAASSTGNLAKSFEADSIVTFLEKPTESEELLNAIQIALA